jgi:hypothetical protein
MLGGASGWSVATTAGLGIHGGRKATAMAAEDGGRRRQQRLERKVVGSDSSRVMTNQEVLDGSGGSTII